MRVMCLLLLCMTVCRGWAVEPIVLVISMDGVRHDFPAREGLPAFARMRRDGGSADRLTPVYPSNTFPGHVSLATGTWPDVHGIVDNVFIDATRGRYSMSADATWLLAEPLWIATERQGVPTATYFWVGSETDWRGRRPSYRMAPFDGRRPEADKVRQILDWLKLPEASRPRLVMSYFAGTDHLSHRFGPGSARIDEQLQLQDRALGDLLAGIDALALWSRLTLIVVSDHGMTAMGDYIDLGDRLADAGIEAEVTGSSVAHVRLADDGDKALAISTLSRIPSVRVLDADAARKLRIAPRERMGDLLVLAEPPITFTRATGWEGVAMDVLRFFGWDFGGHGYAPELPDMGGIFLALGRGVEAGTRFGTVHQTDLASTVTRLLGILPPMASEGRPVSAIRYDVVQAD